jgi:hypothetical protein
MDWTGFPCSTDAGFHRLSTALFVTMYLDKVSIRPVNGSAGSVICGRSRANDP